MHDNSSCDESRFDVDTKTYCLGDHPLGDFILAFNEEVFKKIQNTFDIFWEPFSVCIWEPFALYIKNIQARFGWLANWLVGWKKPVEIFCDLMSLWSVYLGAIHSVYLPNVTILTISVPHKLEKLD